MSGFVPKLLVVPLAQNREIYDAQIQDLHEKICSYEDSQKTEVRGTRNQKNKFFNAQQQVVRELARKAQLSQKMRPPPTAVKVIPRVPVLKAKPAFTYNEDNNKFIIDKLGLKKDYKILNVNFTDAKNLLTDNLCIIRWSKNKKEYHITGNSYSLKIFKDEKGNLIIGKNKIK